MSNRYASWDEYGLRHAPRHLLSGERRQKLEGLLTDFDFIETKCTAGLLFDLLSNYDGALESGDSSGLAQVRQALSLALPDLTERPEIVVQSLYNRLVWFDEIDSGVKERLELARSKLDSRDFWVRAEAPLPMAQVSASFAFPFEVTSGIQSISPSTNAIAIGLARGDVVIHNAVNGELVARRQLGTSLVAAIALSDDSQHSLAYMDRNGTISLEGGNASLLGRKGEKCILYRSSYGVIAVRSDGALVAWRPDRGEAAIIARDLPTPLVVLRSSPSNQHILYVAGYRDQVIGIATGTGAKWITKSIPYKGPSVMDADLDSGAQYLVLACMDRCLRVMDVYEGRSVAQLFYEKREDAHLIGSPGKCAFGLGNADGWVFFSTREGHLACWDWTNDVVKRLENWSTGVKQGDPYELASFSSGQILVSTAERGRILTRQHLYKPLSPHTRPVIECFATESGKIVSMSDLDRSVYWFHANHPDKPLSRMHKDPTAIARCADTDDAIVGDRAGAIWIQSANGQTPKQATRFFAEPVVSMFDVGDGIVLAAGRSGQILRVDLVSGAYERVWDSTGFERQIKILPAGNLGICWNVREKAGPTGTEVLVSLIHSRKQETMVFTGHPRNVAVSIDGKTLCIVEKSVKILEKQSRNWQVVYERDTLVNHAAFLKEDNLLAVTLNETPWLEIWALAKGLPTVAAVHLTEDASCLATLGARLIIGLRSGNLISLRLQGSRCPISS